MFPLDIVIMIRLFIHMHLYLTNLPPILHPSGNQTWQCKILQFDDRPSYEHLHFVRGFLQPHLMTEGQSFKIHFLTFPK